MYTIEAITFEPCSDSEYIRVERMRYVQDGVAKTWDLARVHDSVAVLLYHSERHTLILVKQFRPPVHLHNGDGFTYELCAGIVDKEKSLETIAREEILEECGYDVSEAQIERLTAFYTSVGFAGSKQTLFYAEVDEAMRVNDGGGIETEAIEIVELPVSEAQCFVLDETKAKTPGLMYAFMWFQAERLPGITGR